MNQAVDAALEDTLGTNATSAKRHAKAWWTAFLAALRTQQPNQLIVDGTQAASAAAGRVRRAVASLQASS